MVLKLSRFRKGKAHGMTYQEMLDNLKLTLLGLIEEERFRLWLEQVLRVPAEYDSSALAIWEASSHAPLSKIKDLLAAQVLGRVDFDT